MACSWGFGSGKAEQEQDRGGAVRCGFFYRFGRESLPATIKPGLLCIAIFIQALRRDEFRSM